MLDFFNTLIHYDKQLLLFLHSQGSVFWDAFWVFITNPLHWIPFFIFLYFLGYKAFGSKKAILIALFTASSAATALVLVHFIKNYIQRLRPLNDISINSNIRILMEANDFSFVSGHSTVSFTIAFLSYWVLKKQYKYAMVIFMFPFLFAYSRIYLAVHFPFDILGGMALGFIIAKIFYNIIKHFVNLFDPTNG